MKPVKDFEKYEGVSALPPLPPSLKSTPPHIRLMRGQVVVRELPQEASVALWTPQEGPRKVRTHRGVVLAIGKPARGRGRKGMRPGAEVPHGFKVGDVVQYHFEHHQECWTREWPEDGLPATWLAQHNVDGVWEGLSDDERPTLKELP